MKIAVLSGKGGTGKTFVSTNISRVIENSIYLDCDVEEPNGHLFLKGPVEANWKVSLPIPKVDDNLCDGCKKCVEFCQFNALAYTLDRVMVFEKICHSCGGCEIVCPQNAITEIPREIGRIERRQHMDTSIYTGILKPGEESGTAIISKLLEFVGDDDQVIIDCPPGSSCVVMDSIKDADYCLLVTEPSLFGVHNLKMVHQLVNLFNKPVGVVINKVTEEENPAADYCKNNHIPLLLQVPWSNNLSSLIADGIVVVDLDSYYRSVFQELVFSIRQEVAK